MKKQITKKEINFFAQRLVEDEKSKSTMEKYLRDVNKFSEFVGERDVTKDIVIQYKQHLMENYAPASVNSMLIALNCFFKEIEWNDYKVKIIKIQRQNFRNKDNELTKEEYYRLLSIARRKNTRLFYLMQTICATGIRVSELQFITVEAINCERTLISLKGKNRVVLLPETLCRELKKYAKVRNIIKGSIFITRSGKPLDRSNILHDMKALCKDADVEVEKVYPHNLRHLFACLYYKEIKDLGRLADILGHSNVNTTRIYTCISGEEQRQQIEKLGLII